MPTIHAALITDHYWMIVVCRYCDSVIDLDLRVKRRPARALHASRDRRPNTRPGGCQVKDFDATPMRAAL